MPEMGESVTEGTVLEWHVAEGEAVEEGQTIVEVSTDKVDAEVPAPFSGTITKILVGPDETIEVGKPLAEMVKGAAPEGGSPGHRAEPRHPPRPRRRRPPRTREQHRRCCEVWKGGGRRPPMTAPVPRRSRAASPRPRA